MIHLPVHFGDKTKSKSLEVDFLVVDMPMAYNVILGRPTLHNKMNGREEKIRRGGGLHVGLSTILTLLLLRSLGLSFQRVGGFIPSILALGGRRDKFHLLRVTALNGGPLALIHVVEVPEGVGATLLVALLLSLGRINPSLLQLTLHPLLLALTGV
ncbi:hypothetical protein Cgig2_027583 [Carnegiea gigantea]|uniref:Uncharacterized protein n=1 Tax=Carnegiea gigantea TaxID=171969 RepID=A0A9Q1GTU7_9CARY|nr:hypothetical protein Cgig2_027583 [Carnegiea gigantea]